MLKLKNIFSWSHFSQWRLKNMQERYYILLIAILIGMLSGLGTVILKSSVHFVKDILVKSFARDYFNVMFFIFPVIGIFIVLLILKFILRQKNGFGIASTLYAIAKRKGIMKIKTIFAPLFTTAITVGFGGSAGVEGPAVASGSAIGSFVSQKFKLSFKQTGLLLSCGAAGAMASSLNAPITGLIFTLEVLMLDLTSFSILPLLAASVSGVLMTRIIYGGSYLIPVSISESFALGDVPFYIMLGLVTGLISVYFERMFWFMEDTMKQFKNTYIRFLLGSTMLGLLIFLVPSLFGEGYDTINYLLSGDYIRILDHSPFISHNDNMLVIILLLFGLALFKVIATSLTISSGGVGGVVAPSIFTGATIGFVFSKVINQLDRFNLNETNYTLVGMAGVFAGILHAPLTAIFLIAELTGGYTLMLPLMLTVSLSYLTVKFFVPHSIYNKQLVQRKELLTHHKDKLILHIMNIDEVIETDFSEIKPRTKLREIVSFVAQSNRNIFPVVNEERELKGIIFMDKIRKIMFNHELYDEIYVEQLMNSVTTYIDIKDHMETVMDKFTESGAWNLPVLENGKYLGFLSKSAVLSEYRKKMVEHSDE